ncbi:MAG TPA: hypothetical protein VKT83_04045 [bacterium]|nr:hypothetical protein [bacterium]
MTLFEIPSDIQQMMNWGLRGIQALAEAVAAVFAEFWAAVARPVGDTAVRTLPVLSKSEQDTLITFVVVVVAAVAALLVVGTLRLVAPSGHGPTSRLRQRHR